MTTNVLRTIIDGLNSEPFNRKLSLINFDSQSPEKLLQTLSDVICWIQGISPLIDLRTESPDETAIRIMNALRILKYPPPRDIEQVHKWRLDILEGNKSAVYPILEWIFENVDRLKERVYLSTYLTRVEVPAEEQSPEVIRIMNNIEEKIAEFKEVHMRIVESRSDFIRTEDIRNDLKSMNEEKVQLIRKIERSRRKVNRTSDLNKYLEIAGRLNAEKEKNQELQLQRQEQRNALVNTGQRLARFERALNEAEREKDTVDPRVLISKLKGEIEVNNYMLKEKVINDINTERLNVEAVKKILGMKSVNKNDIDKLKKKIEQLNEEIVEMSLQRDKKDEASEDKLVIYRHQSANIQRKKANVASSLQSTRQEMEDLENTLSTKKRELTEKSGQDEVVTSVQYKQYVKKLRNKSNFYKRKKAELEQAKGEIQILERTVEVLNERFDEIKRENKAEGRSIIENLEGIQISQQRPQTAKPLSSDIVGLKNMIDRLNYNINEKRSIIQELNEKIENFYHEHKEENEEFYSELGEIEALQEKMNKEVKESERDVNELQDKLNKETEEIKANREYIAKLTWFIENLETPEKTEIAAQLLEKQNTECLKAISELNHELAINAEKGDASEQIAMWEGLILLLRTKIQTHNKKFDGEQPIGDRI